MKTGPFERHHERYDRWFENHEKLYESELEAVRELIPKEGQGIEIGVGSGRFSTPLSIEFGLDPSKEMLKLADERGIRVIRGIGEKLPFKDESFDFALIVTTICFFDDPSEALKETARILKPEGAVVIGFIDKESPLGHIYQKKKDDNVFYSAAKFFSVEEVIQLLNQVEFSNFSFVQTLFGGIDRASFEKPKKGYDEGSFVVVSARK
ncbi:MAG: class I SAM-dependent methyltransferase [Candidatus Thermoplasmatota archaeon]|nr:class I SAM-dependent methyltransferase [Candidatus Thermoplasmatota archaeon]